MWCLPSAVLLMVLALVTKESEAYRVLFVGAYSSKSHTHFYMAVIKELAKKGNHVTFITPFPSKKNISNVREVDSPEGSVDLLAVNRFNESIRGVGAMFKYLRMCPDTMESNQVQEVLQEKYDVVMMGIYFSDCYLSVVHQQKIPFLYVSSLGLLSGTARSMGNPFFPSIVPSIFSDHRYPMTFLQRIHGALEDVSTELFFRFWFFPAIERDCRRRGLFPEDMPSLYDMRRTASIAIVNSVKELEVPIRPYIPGIIHAGGLHCRPAKPLPQDLEEWVDGAGEDGFIFFSLGSVVTPSDLSEKRRQIFVKVFGSLKQRVLWKWDKETMPDLPPNVRLQKWLPQQDILGHPKIRLFITHGGLNSIMESLYHETPILGLPVFADQVPNMLEADHKGWGKALLWEDLTEENLLSKINLVMEDKKIQEEVKFRSSLMRDHPMSPGEQVTYWVDYVVRYKGAKHLRSPLADMPWYEVYNVDVWITVILASALILWLSYRMLLALFKCLCGKSKTKLD